MGGIKDREAKKKANHVYSGGSGGGTKGPSTVDKRKQQLQCPYCERIFQHKDRYNAHLTSKHADEVAEADETPVEGSDSAAASTSSGKVMQVGSKAGYYTRKSPQLFLLEQCQSDKRPKPKIKILTKDSGKFGCRVIFPHPKKAELDEFAYLPDELLADNEDDAKQRGSLAGLHHIAGHRALERVLPEEFLSMWSRLGELRQRKEAQAASRAAREEKHQAQKARQNKMEMKHRQNNNVVSISTDHIEELYRIVCSDKMSALAPDGDSCVSLEASTINQLKQLGCTDEHVQAVTLGLQRGGGLQDALDWLCMHLPEEELPSTLRQKYGGNSVRVKLAGGQPSTPALATSPGGLCLTRMGYSAEDVDAAMQQCSGTADVVARAWKILLQSLAGCELGAATPNDADILQCFGSPAGPVEEAVLEPQWPEPEEEEDPQAKAWWDEQFACASVYPDAVVRATERCTVVQLAVPHSMVQAYCTSDLSQPQEQQYAQLGVVLWEGCGYPQALPLMCVRCQALPPPVRLQFTASVVAHLQQECSGMEMLHQAYMHLEGLLADEPPNAIVASLRWSCILQVQSNVGQQPRREAEAPQPKVAAKKGPGRDSRPARVPPGHVERESRRLEEAMKDNHSTGPGRKMLAARQKLPAHGKRQEVLSAVSGHRVTVISGATGCGKSTQVPQYILEQEIDCGQGGAANIICTQPRRLPAIALANRVSDEMLQRVGSTVGYSIRLEKKMSQETHLLFCTTGILLRRLTSDRDLADVTHVIVDEVHERSLDSDLLLLLLRDVMQKNINLRLVLMSATADADLFARYFDKTLSRENGKSPVCVVDIPGFTYPVRELHLEDALTAICNKGLGAAPLLTSGELHGLHYRITMQHVLQWEQTVRCLQLDRTQSLAEGFQFGRAAHVVRSPRSLVLEASHIGQKVLCSPGKIKEAEINERLERLENLNRHTGIPCSQAVLKSIAEADEFSLDYSIVEAAIAHVIQEEARGGESALLQNWEGLDAVDLSRVGKLDGPGAILVFLPGSIEISKLQKQLKASARLKTALNGDEAQILPLHGSLAPAQQQAVFRRFGRNCRKIVLSTNIAETSVTIEDVTIVIDTGKMKEIQVDSSSGITRLADTWVSRAASKQRRGRAGRVRESAQAGTRASVCRPGVCIRLFSRLQWKQLREHQLPEMKRVPLEPLCLHVKSTLPERKVAEALAQALTPPDPAVVQRALELLSTRQLITEEEQLSALGHHISRIPLDPALGKMLLYAAILQCTDPLLTVAAAVSYGRPVFLSPEAARAEANAARREIIGDSLAAKSDHLATVHAFATFLQTCGDLGDRGAQQWCRESFVSYDAMLGIRSGRFELVKSLLETGFVNHDYVNRVRRGEMVDYSDPHDKNSGDARVVKAAICAGFYPQVLRVENPASKYAKVAGGAFETNEGQGIPKLFERTQGRVFVHPSSVNAGVTKFDTGWMVFTEIIQTSKVFVRQCSSIPKFALLMFGGKMAVEHKKAEIILDSWARLNASPKVAVLVKEIRARVDHLLAIKLDHPETDIESNAIVAVLLELLRTDGI